MRAFSYTVAPTIDAAIQAYSQSREARYIGGGTNLVDLMKMGVERPTCLIDINKLPLNRVEEREGGVRIGALVSNTDAAEHELIRTRYPVLSKAILAGASQQLRNMASVGGNLLQRTRCYYFYDPSYAECNKRAPGSGCAALNGFNRIHAILGQSSRCIAVNPSDMCVALAALDATVQVAGPKGERSVPFGEFHRLPADTPHIETSLEAGELVTAVDLPAIPYSRRSFYLKVRDRHSYAFALVSAAVILDLDGDTIREARIALGGVALKPWRAGKAEKAIAGKKLDPAVLRKAAEEELSDAQAYAYNGFKIELAKRCIVRAVLDAAKQVV